MKYGEFVLIDKKYETRIIRSKDFWFKKWDIREIKPILCLCIGFRTIYEGEIEEGYDPDSPRIFTPKKSIKVTLVVSSPREKPFYVPIREKE